MFASSLARLAVLALLIVPTLGQQITIDCLATGVAGNCSEFITPFCDAIGPQTVPLGGSTSLCFPADFTTNGRCDFTAINTLVAEGTITVQNCITALTAVSAACPLGGNGQFAGGEFQFNVDPKTGACVAN